MTILGPATLKAIRDHKMAQRLAEKRKQVADRVEARNGKQFYVERRQRLADLRRKQREFQARLLVPDRGLGKKGGLGREDIAVWLRKEYGDLRKEHPGDLTIKEANEIARAAVFGRKT